MIEFENDILPSWQNLQSIGLKRRVRSVAQFASELKTQWPAALALLGPVDKAVPGCEALAMVHKIVFDPLLEKAGGFRSDISPVAFERSLLSLPNEFERPLTKGRLLDERRPSKQIEMLSLYHWRLMQSRPFDEIPGSIFINRTVATIVLEGQINHCFGAVENRLIDGRKYESAIQLHRQGLSAKATEEIVALLVGDRAKVLHMEKWRQYQAGFGRER